MEKKWENSSFSFKLWITHDKKKNGNNFFKMGTIPKSQNELIEIVMQILSHSENKNPPLDEWEAIKLQNIEI